MSLESLITNVKSLESEVLNIVSESIDFPIYARSTMYDLLNTLVSIQASLTDLNDSLSNQ